MNRKRILVKQIKAATHHLFRSTTENHDKTTTAESDLWRGNEPRIVDMQVKALSLNPLNSELNPICYLLALLGAHHFLHVSRIRVKSLTLRRLMSYIYGAPILDVSRSHTTTQHSR